MTVNGPDGKTYTIEGATPDDITPEEARRYVMQAMDQGVTTIQYEGSAPSMTMQERARERASLERAAQQNPSPTTTMQERAQQRMAAQEAEQQQPTPSPVQEERGGFNLTGLPDEFRPLGEYGVLRPFAPAIRGAGPTAAGAVAGGAVAGPPGAAAGAGVSALWQQVGPGLTQMANKVYQEMHGTDRVAFASPEDMAEDFFQLMQIPEARNKLEQLEEDSYEAVAHALAGVASGKAFFANSRLGNLLTSRPAEQVKGAVGGAIGAAAGEEIADRTDAGPWARLGLQLVLGFIGDTAASQAWSTPTRRGAETFQGRMEEAGRTPEQAREAIELGREMNVPITRSDIGPPISQRAQINRGIRETLVNPRRETRPGEWRRFFGEPTENIAQQKVAQTQALDRVLDTFGVRRNQDSQVAQRMRDTFVTEYGDQLTQANNNRTKALQALSGETPIATNRVNDFIDQEVANLVEIGVDPKDSRISNLLSWKERLQGQSPEAIFRDRGLRDELHNLYTTPRADGTIDPANEVYNELWIKFRDDIGDAIAEQGGPEARRAWEQSNESFTELYRLRNNEVFKEVFRNLPKGKLSGGDLAENPEIIEHIATTAQPEDVELLLPRLGPSGREMVNTALMERTLRDSIRSDELQDLSMNQIATLLKNRMARFGYTMNEDELKRIDGLAKVLDVTRRPTQALRRGPERINMPASEVPGVGYSTARVLARNVLVGGATVLGSLLTATNLAKVYESPRTRDMLLDIVEEGITSTRADDIARSIWRTLDTVNDGENLREAAGEATERTREFVGNTREALSETQLFQGQ